MLPRIAGKVGEVEQLKRRWLKSTPAWPERELPPELVAAIRHLQACSRGQTPEG